MSPSTNSRTRRIDPPPSSSLPDYLPNRGRDTLSPGSESDLDTSSVDGVPVRKSSVYSHASSSSSQRKHSSPFPDSILVIDENTIDFLSIYRNPLVILSYFVAFLARASKSSIHALLTTYRIHVIWTMSLLFIVALTSRFDGIHQPFLLAAESFIRWYGSWAVLGILSSVGLGSGLHTFLLFLGPHIAQVTSAAYSCGHINFVSRTWDQIVCKQLSQSAVAIAVPVTLFSVARKVQWDAFCWGMGTAIGELPPYFVSRAAAQSGKRNAELVDLDELLNKRAADMSWAEWAKVQVMLVMRQFGFWGILACASIPNPLFDLAGIICGTVGIPFRTFFGATLIGKAIIKTSIQSVFVAVLFSRGGQATLLQILDTWAPTLHAPVSTFLAEQTNKYMGTNGNDSLNHSHIDESSGGGAGNLIRQVWNIVITLMLAYFLFSIVESLAKQEMERLVAQAKGDEPSSILIGKRMHSRSRSRSRSRSTSMGNNLNGTLSLSPTKTTLIPPAPVMNNGVIRDQTNELNHRHSFSRGRSKVLSDTSSSSKRFDATTVRDSDADAELSSPAESQRTPARRRSKRTT